MYAYKDLLKLVGLTTRIYTLLSTINNLPSLPLIEHGGTIQLIDVDVGIPPTNITGAQEVDLEGHEREPTQVLVKDLSLVLKEGERLMITGSNGVGTRNPTIKLLVSGLFVVLFLKLICIHTLPGFLSGPLRKDLINAQA
jgi:ABC-type uncharacterized transport system fused permease/ATPase subunit